MKYFKLAGAVLLFLAAVFLAGGFALSDSRIEATVGSGANARAEGVAAVLEAQANSIQSESQSKASLAETQRQDLESYLNETRDYKVTKTNRLNKSLGIAGSVALVIGLLSLGLGFGGYTILMSLFVLPARQAISPIKAQIGSTDTLFFPTMNKALVHDRELKGQYGVLDPKGFQIHEGDPTVSIEATRTRALVDATKHQSGNPHVGPLVQALTQALHQHQLSGGGHEED